MDLQVTPNSAKLPTYHQLKDSGVASREINSWDQEKFCHWDDYQLNHTNSSTDWLGSWSLPQCITGTERFLESSHLWEKRCYWDDPPMSSAPVEKGKHRPLLGYGNNESLGNKNQILF
jgi:hypothetical protein